MRDLVVPKHVAIIMDGNGRWAQEKGLPRVTGHRQGLARIREIVRAASSAGVKYLTVYAFSTENWKRPKAEVAFLMNACRSFLKRELPVMMREKMRFIHIGRLRELPSSLQKMIHKAKMLTEKNDAFHIQLAFNYGSRRELVDACRKIAGDVKKEKLKVSDIDEQTMADHLYTRGIPDPDFLIRTSGEKRISNFLLWQLSYAELYFTKKTWPEFNAHEFMKAIKEYGERSRRFGGLHG